MNQILSFVNGWSLLTNKYYLDIYKGSFIINQTNSNENTFKIICVWYLSFKYSQNKTCSSL